MATYLLRKIDDSLWRRIKALCALQDRTPEDLITMLLTNYLNQTDGLDKIVRRVCD